ncbi:MAG: ABC transporter permease subunit [Lachnospiraceae bacterium]|nr:ABC transporter permease subunit [Lachnospiraceae bacterium]
MNKIVIGMNLKYRIPALISLAIGFIAMFLSVVTVGEKSFNALTMATMTMAGGKFAYSYVIIVALYALALVLGLVLLFMPGKVTGKCLALVSAAKLVAVTLVMFMTKAIVDTNAAFGGKFMVKDFSVGYWLMLVLSLCELVNVLKVNKINTGYIVLTVMSIIWLFPILWIVLTSLRKEQGYYVGYFFPKGYTIENFTNLFKNTSVIPFGRWWINTFIVACFSCVLVTLIILMTSFALSRVRFEGRSLLMKIMLVIGMFPGFMSMIAVYNILKGIGLAQTLVALVVVNAAGAAMGYYICKGFFDTIPKSLDEAAIIDGATRWQIFTRITIPLSKPIIIYTILTSFLGPWTDYIFPSMVLGDKQSMYTVAIGLKWLTDFQRIDTYYCQFAAGSLMVSVPIVILFIALQRFYVEGLSGAVKG